MISLRCSSFKFFGVLVVGATATAEASCVAGGQMAGSGQCDLFYYSIPGYGPACTGQCIFEDGSTASGFPTCTITADASKCPAAESQGNAPECNCKVNGRDWRICATCGSSGINDPVTVATIQSGAEEEEQPPPDLGTPDVDGGTCSVEYSALFACYVGAVKDASIEACKTFQMSEISEQLTFTTCAEANDKICSMSSGCCDDKVQTLAQCISNKDLGLTPCTIDCIQTEGTTNAGYAASAPLAAAGIASTAAAGLLAL